MKSSQVCIVASCAHERGFFISNLDMRFFFAVCLAVTVSGSSLVDCGNGVLCPADSTCVADLPGGGRQWACAPMAKAVIW